MARANEIPRVTLSRNSPITPAQMPSGRSSFRNVLKTNTERSTKIHAQMATRFQLLEEGKLQTRGNSPLPAVIFPFTIKNLDDRLVQVKQTRIELRKRRGIRSRLRKGSSFGALRDVCVGRHRKSGED